MILLSPPKLLMILAIALIVLGPDKLPSAARRVGALWSDFTRWRTQLESEVRSTFPDLPSTTEIARAVRSPLTLLDRLADEHGAAPGADAGNSAGAGASGSTPREPTAAGSTPREPTAAGHGGSQAPSADPDVSLMN